MSRIGNLISKQANTAVFPLVCVDHCARLLNIRFSEVTNDGKKLSHALAHGYRLYNYDMVFLDPCLEAQSLCCQVWLEPFLCLLGPKSDKSLDRTDEIIKASELLKNTWDVQFCVSIEELPSLVLFLTGIGDPMASANVISPALYAKFAYTLLKTLIPIVQDKGLLSGIHALQFAPWN